MQRRPTPEECGVGGQNATQYAVAIDRAQRFLRASSGVLALWIAFAAFLAGLAVFIVYRMVKTVMAYVNFSNTVKRMKTANPDDPENDNQTYPSYSRADKVPGGSSILQRVRRFGLSRDSLANLKDSLDPSMDSYTTREKASCKPAKKTAS